jgi:hypothetical protein
MDSSKRVSSGYWIPSPELVEGWQLIAVFAPTQNAKPKTQNAMLELSSFIE